MFGGSVTPVTLEAEDWMAGIIIDRFGFDTPIVPLSNGKFECRIEAALSKQFVGWLVGLGKGIKVISPPAAVKLIQDETKRLVEDYLS